MDSLTRMEYADKILSSLPPADAVTVLRDRLGSASRANEEIAEWIDERYRIEQQYASALARLSTRSIPTDIATAGLGTFVEVWSKFLESTSALAGASQSFANKLSTEIVGPVRSYANSNQDWAEMRAIQENLSSVAREIESAEDKVEKYKKKGSSKIAGAHQNVNNAVAEWDSQAPLVFEKLQGIDEARLVMLKDVLTRYETSEVDKAQRAVSLCEENLNSLLSFDPQDEIKMYGLQIQTNGVPHTARTSSRHPPPPPPHIHQTASPASTVYSAVAVPSPAMPSPSSKRRTSVATADTSSSSPSSSKSKFSRMSTILRPGKGETGRRGLFGHKDKDKNKYREQIDVSPVREPSHMSSETASIASSRSRSSRPEPPPPRTTSGAVPVLPTPATVASGPTTTSSQPVPPFVITNGNGNIEDPDAINVIGTVDHSDLPIPIAPPPSQPIQPVLASQPQPQPQLPQVDSEGFSIPPPIAKDSALASLEDDLTASHEQSSIKVDIQSQTIKDEQDDAQAAVERVAASLRSRPTISGRSMRGRRGEIQSKLFTGGSTELDATQGAHSIPPPPPPHRGEPGVPSVAPIEEEAALGPAEITEGLENVSEPGTVFDNLVETQNEAAEAAPVVEKEAVPEAVEERFEEKTEQVPPAEYPSVASPPVLSPLSTEPAVTEKAAESVPESVVTSEPYYSPISAAPFTPQDSYTPVVEPVQRAAPVAQRMESSTSITSPTSSTTVAAEHPQESIVPGLSSSVVETVHASLQNGAPTRVLIVGEIALSFASTTTSTPSPVPLRLTNTSALDRVLPNQSFLAPSESEDEYVLHSATLSSAPAIAFKYSITSLSYAPIIVDPIWKFEPHQTSVMLYYFVNPDFPVDQLTVSEMSIQVAIEGARATACRSKPSGVFDQETAKLSIPIAGEGQEVTLRKTDEKVQVLVRFLNDGLAKESSAGGVVVKFRYSPPSDLEGVGVEVLDVAKKSGQETVDPFADEAGAEGEWSLVPVVRSVVAGQYFATESA
ncbi:Muniscin C-terminal mu homology domain-containing protein [Lipomyces orientalis]|uniref:Muniscin C-terminal mu homology domain-containing protein n=1 Tax=Lipomyces orientalis TaxID=1233043 RepID=A0ACC3TV23_9ASCO